MNKKGAIISLEALVKFIPILLIAIVGLYVLFTIWGSFFQESISASEYDMLRVKRNLESIGPTDRISVFTTGKEYELYLYSEESSPALCGSKTCLCVHNKVEGNYAADPSKCEPFKDIKKCTSDKKTCFSGTESVEIKNTDTNVKEFVNICKNNDGKISIEGKC